MDQNDIYVDWCKRLATEIAEELIVGKVIDASQVDFVTRIAEQELYVHLVSGDRPDPTGRFYATR